MKNSPQLVLKGRLNSNNVGTHAKKANNLSLERAAGPVRAVANRMKVEASGKPASRSLDQVKVGSKASNSSNMDGGSENAADEMERFTDEYLLSELVLLKSNKILEHNSEKVDQEVASSWLHLEELRRKVLEVDDKNLKLAKLIDLSASLEKEISIFRPFVEANVFSDKNLVDLSNSLERSRHNLQVIGAEVSNDLGPICSSRKPAFKGPTFDVETSTLSTLQQNLSSALQEFDECRKSSSAIEQLCIEAASLQLSRDRLEDSTDRPDRIRSLTNVPAKPDVQLVRI